MSHHSEHSHEPEGITVTKRYKWVVVTGIVLMLVAMVVYVFTMDMSLAPNSPNHRSMPAAPPTAP